MWAALRDRIRGDRGAVLVLTALVLPLCILFCGFVIDVANWFEHKRHLQTQADAAALAGAGSFLSCPDNDEILVKSDEYGGGTWNPQVGEAQDSVHMEVNSKTFYNQPGWEDSTVKDDPPCEAGMVDVKLTETDLPWWFDLTQDVDYINAHARVEFQQVDTLAGAMPFGVPDVKPVAARVWFVDEDTGQTLTKTTGGPAEQTLSRRTYANGVAIWDNLDSTVEVSLPNTGPSNIGARVALSGTTSTTCGQPLVECYDLGNPKGGILYARAWAAQTATSTAPQARHVGLTGAVSGGCSDPYFVEVPVGGCNVGVLANLDFGGGNPSNYQVHATVGNKKYSLQYNQSDGLWHSNQLVPIDPAVGPVPIGLEWKNGNQTGSFGIAGAPVQRTFSAGARSGPIKTAVLWANDAPGVSSLERCSATNTACTYRLAVQLGIQGSFQDIYNDLQNVSAPVTLRFAGGTSGSQNQALDCDPWAEDNADPDLKLPNGTRSFIGEIALGCRPAYTPNQGNVCPANTNTLWGSSTSRSNQGPAWQCVAVETGDRVSQLATGLNLRILNDKNPTTCTHPNNWNPARTGGPGPDPASSEDPRIVQLFLTQFGAFSSSGQNTVAVTNFATFYITGWKGQGGHTSPCANPPAGMRPDDPVTEAGTVVGHWMEYRGTLGDSSGTKPCDFDSPTPCVFSLTE